MSEIRIDPLTKHTVIIASGRAARPTDFRAQNALEKPQEPNPFAPGNESMTPPEKQRVADANGDWIIRVFDNKFPALAESASPHSAHTFYESHAGQGVHEVIVETPDPLAQLDELTPQHCEQLLEVYQQRMHYVREQGLCKATVIKNVGRRAGASLAHPHSQLLGHDFVDQYTRTALKQSTAHATQHSRSLFEDIIATETRDQQRVVHECDHFLSFCPYASRFAYELRIFPKTPGACFANATTQQLQALTPHLQHCVCTIRHTLGNPAYNYIIHNAPFTHTQDPHYRWHLALIPVTNELGGFERGTDNHITTTSPEQAAALLRENIR